MHQPKGKKILVYFFLLILVGSVNNINLNNLRLNKINYIKVSGLEDEENLSLLKRIKSLNLNNIFLINAEKIKDEIELNSLVEKYYIFKLTNIMSFGGGLWGQFGQANYKHTLYLRLSPAP